MLCLWLFSGWSNDCTHFPTLLEYTEKGDNPKHTGQKIMTQMCSYGDSKRNSLIVVTPSLHCSLSAPSTANLCYCHRGPCQQCSIVHLLPSHHTDRLIHPDNRDRYLTNKPTSNLGTKGPLCPDVCLATSAWVC